MNEHAIPRGVIVGETDKTVTFGFPNGVTTTMRRGSLELPQPTGAHVETDELDHSIIGKLVHKVLSLTTRRRRA